MKAILLRIFTLLIFQSVFLYSGAQQVRPMRLEYPVAEDSQPYQVIPLHEQGILLFYRAVAENEKTENKWVVALIDINLRQEWVREFPLPEEFEYKFSYPNKDTVFIGFQNTGKRGNMKNASLVLVDIKSGSIKLAAEDIPEKNELTAGRLFNGYFVMGMKSKDDRTSILVRNIEGSYKNTFQLESSGKTFLEDITLLPGKAGFTIIYEDFKGKKESVFVIRSFDFLANPIESYILDVQSDQNTLNTVKIIPLSRSKQLVLGAYSNEKSKTFVETENRSEESTGFFGGLVIDNDLSTHNYYNFLDFKNFFNRLRGDQAIYDGKNPKKNKEISSDYRLILHDIIRQNSEFILVAEAYYPEYHTVTNWSYDYYGQMVPTYYTVFDGYRYNNAFVCAFDSTGKLLWENSMEINNLLSMTIKQRVNLFFDDKDIIISYLTEGKIASKVIQRDQTIDGIEYSAIENSDTRDKILENPDGTLVYWYNNYLIAYGYQQIKNVSRAETRRNVFYINKIAFR